MEKLTKINFQSRVSIAENEKKNKQNAGITNSNGFPVQPVVSRKVCGLDSVDKPFYLAIKNMLLLQ